MSVENLLLRCKSKTHGATLRHSDTISKDARLKQFEKLLQDKGEVAAKGAQSMSDCDVIEAYMFDYQNIVDSCPEELKHIRRHDSSDFANNTFRSRRNSRRSQHTLRSQSSHVSRTSSSADQQKSESHTETSASVFTDSRS